MQAILDGATQGASQRAEGEDPAMIEGGQEKEKEVWVTAGQVLVEMHVTDWATAQKEDPKLNTVLQWLESKKKTDLRTLLGEHASSEEGQMVWRNHQNFTTLQGTLLSALPPQKGRMRICYSFVVLKMPLDCHLKLMPSRCRTSRPQPYTILIARLFLMAKNGQADVTSY